MKKWLAICLGVMAIFIIAATFTTRVSSYTTFYTNSDVADSPDTTLIDNLSAFARGTRGANTIDLLSLAGAGKNHYAKKVQFVFSHGGTPTGDALTSVFELHGAVDNGPRQLICTLALTGGKAVLVSGVSTSTWVDTAVVTNYRNTQVVSGSEGVIVDDSGSDRVARVTVLVRGLRYLEGLFTGGGSTASSAVAYIRYYNE